MVNKKMDGSLEDLVKSIKAEAATKGASFTMYDAADELEEKAEKLLAKKALMNLIANDRIVVLQEDEESSSDFYMF